MSQTIKPGRQVREATLEKIEGDKRTVMLSFASEAPVARFYGNEILSCRSGDVDLTRMSDGAPLLFNHDPSELIGVVESASIDPDRVCRALVRISRNCDDVLNDIQDGIIRKVSVGYETKSILSDTPESKTAPRSITWSWMPFEISLVSVPADNSVGIGRSAGGDETNKPPELPAQEKKMSEKKEDIAAPAVKVEVRDNSEQTRKESSEIVKLCRQHNAPELAERALDKGLSLADVRAELLETVSKRTAKPAVQGESSIGLSEREAKQFSIMNVIRAMSGDKSADICFELEVSAAAAKKQGRAAQGVIVPIDVLLSGKRDLTVAGTGSNIVATNLLAGSFIDALRRKSVAAQLGVQYMAGLVGDVALPKLSTTSTAYWVSEGNAPTESTPVLAQVTGSPNTCGTYVDLSRKLLKQGTPDAEMLVRDDLTKVLALAIDAAVFTGAGTNEPLGIVGTSGVANPSVTAGTPTHAEILSFIQAIGDANGNLDMCKWAFTYEVWAKLSAIFTNATYGSIPLADPVTGKCVGFPYIPTNQVGANTAIFGDFSMVTLGMWGGLDLTVDPYTSSNTGAVRVVALQDVDVMVRQPAALAYNSAVTS